MELVKGQCGKAEIWQMYSKTINAKATYQIVYFFSQK